MKAKPAELIISLAVVALGAAVAVGTTRLSGASGYARIGPNAAPAVVAGGLILLGLWLLYEALSGGWRNAIPDQPEARGEHRFYASAFIWVSVGLFAADAVDAPCRLCARSGRSICLRRPWLWQHTPRAGFCHRPCPWTWGFSFLRQIS